MRTRSAVAMLCVVLVGCLDDGTSLVDVTSVPRPSLIKAPAIQDPGTADGRAAALAPEYAGVYVDSSGRVVVNYQAGRSPRAAEAAARNYFSDIMRNRAVMHRPVRYSYQQLAAWYDMVSARVLGNGAVMIDLDEVNNRIYVAAQQSEALPGIRAALSGVIPGDALEIGVTGADALVAYPLDGPWAYGGPHPGGMAGQVTPNPRCTLAVNVRLDGEVTSRHMLTASHCTPEWLDRQAAHTAWQAGREFGYEAIDPHWHTSATNTMCPSNRWCRWTDIAVIRVTDVWTLNEELYLGGIARTYYGTSIIDEDRPRFAVTGTGGSLVPGVRIEKVGISTGWDHGTIRRSCFRWDYNGGQVPDPVTLYCMYEVDNMPVMGGDSGGPVFTMNADSTVAFVGVTTASLNNGTRMGFTSIGQAYRDFGTYCSPWLCGLHRFEAF